MAFQRRELGAGLIGSPLSTPKRRWDHAAWSCLPDAANRSADEALRAGMLPFGQHDAIIAGAILRSGRLP
jgi:hypothetical protein